MGCGSAVPISSDEQLTAARAAIERNDLQRAHHLLDELLMHHPEHDEALLYRGQLFRERGQLEDALRDWRRVSQKSPHLLGTARYLEATVLLEQRQARRGEQRLREAAELHPAYPQPLQRLLELYLVQLRRNEVHGILDHIRQMRPWTIDELAFQIVSPLRVTTPDSGAELMRDYMMADADDTHSRVALGRYLIASEQYADAIEVLRHALQRSSQDQHIAGILAEALIKQRATDDAHEILSAWTPEETSAASLWRSWGLAASAREDWPVAIHAFRRTLAAEPEDSAALYLLGQALQRDGQTEMARECLKYAQQTDRLQRQAMRLVWGDRTKLELMIPIALDVANQLSSLGRPAEAALWFEQVLSIAPGHPVARTGLSRARTSVNSSDSVPHWLSSSDPVPANMGITPSVSALSEKSGLGAPNDQISIRLRDVHAQAGVKYQYFNGQTEFKYLLESTGGGVAVFDYDCDGWPDLVFPQGCPLPFHPDDERYLDRIVRNHGDGTFEDVTAEAGLHGQRYSQGATVGDFDNDGFADLFIANFGRNTFLHNNGDGTFTDITEQVGVSGEVMSSSAALADLDRDGLLDLYIVNYVDSMKVCRNPDGTYNACNPSNFDGEQDQLFWNRGDGTFEDVTSTSGIIAPDGKGLGIVAADFNEDGWSDLYVANDTTPNFLFRNLSTEGELLFVEEGLVAGVALGGEGRAQAGMGVACADLDRNGLLDLYVTNFFQETNTLYLNQGNSFFVDATRTAGLAEPTHGLLGFGTQAVDLNLDGFPELFVANGHIDDFRFRGEPWKMSPQLFQNVGNAEFVDRSEQSGAYFQGTYLGRGVARLDWNRDGRPDLVVVHQDHPAALLRNETINCGNCVVLQLHGTQSNRDAIGARIRVTRGNDVQYLQICGGDGFFSSNERRTFIGLGAHESIDLLEIDWPSNRRQAFREIPANIQMTVIENRLEPVLMPLSKARF